MGQGLTDIQCRAASSPNKKITKFSNGGGLFLWVYDSGKKGWRYRFDGREKSLTFGNYPKVALISARRMAADVTELISRGRYPSLEKQLTKINQGIKAANTFESISWEWFDKQVHLWLKTHALDVERRL